MLNGRWLLLLCSKVFFAPLGQGFLKACRGGAPFLFWVLGLGLGCLATLGGCSGFFAGIRGLYVVC
jgi:hypothetical protein